MTKEVNDYKTLAGMQAESFRAHDSSPHPFQANLILEPFHHIILPPSNIQESPILTMFKENRKPSSWGFPED